jgi:hypothetical protein
MNYEAFTNDSLTMMYEAIRGAMAADDALKRQGMEIRFRVRETPDWKKHAGELESEMLKTQPASSAGKIERPTAVRTVFERPGGCCS